MRGTKNNDKRSATSEFSDAALLFIMRLKIITRTTPAALPRLRFSCSKSVPSLAFSLLPLLFCVPYFPCTSLLRFTGFTDNAPKRFFKLRPRNEHPMAAAHALQPDIHACAHDLPTVTAAGMRFFHFHYISHIYLNNVHPVTPSSSIFTQPF